MHVYVYKESYCDKDEMKESKKFLRWHNRLEAINLIGKVLCERYPGGQLSYGETVQVQLPGDNFPR